VNGAFDNLTGKNINF
jgi:2-oxoglutarate dehydrogenase complex dehydrogenase (E1) component-like enzyme